jgi:hypothetical protein
VWFVPAAGFNIEGDCDNYCLVANFMFGFSGVLTIAQLLRNSKNLEVKLALAIAIITAE